MSEKVVEGKEHRQLTIALVIGERDGRFLILRRVDDQPEWHHKWELPGGKIDPGESPLYAAQRELLEETDLTLVEPQLLGVHTHHWHMPTFTQQTFILVYRGGVHGDEIRMQPDENDAYKWVTREEYMAMPDTLGANANIMRDLYFGAS